MRRSRILTDADLDAPGREAAAEAETVFVVLRGAELVGVYADLETATAAAGGHLEYVIPCDVLDQAP